jgi:hypothetical protein
MTSAADAVLVRRMTAFVTWLGQGRTLTQLCAKDGDRVAGRRAVGGERDPVG